MRVQHSEDDRTGTVLDKTDPYLTPRGFKAVHWDQDYPAVFYWVPERYLCER